MLRAVSATIALLTVPVSAQRPPNEVLLHNQAGTPGGTVPGTGLPFDAGGSAGAAFGRPVLSPSGNHWAVTARLETAQGVTAADDEVLLVDGRPFLREGDPAPWGAPGETVGRLDPVPALGDGGDVLVVQDTGGTAPVGADDVVVLFPGGGGAPQVVAREGAAVPFLPGATWDGPFREPVLGSLGRIGFVAEGVDGLPGGAPGGDDIVVFDGVLVARQGVTVPGGQVAGTPAPWAGFANGGWQVAPGPPRNLIRGTLASTGTTDEALALNGSVVLREGVPIPPFVEPVAWIDQVRIDDGGTWFSSGSNASGVDWLVRSGFLVAVSNLAVPIVPGAVETWADTSFSPCFFGFDGDADGSFVVGGTTDAADPSGNAVVVLGRNGRSRLLVREGDPVDLDGDGVLDDDRFVDVFGTGDLALGGGWFWFVCSLRDGDGVPRDNALVRVPTDAPIARFGFDAVPGSSGRTLQFVDRSSWDRVLTSWRWDFDGDGVVDSTARNPSFTFASPGPRRVTLTVSDGTASGRTTVPVDVAPLRADFDATPRSGTLPLSVGFTDRSSGNPTSWSWDLDGDGVVDSTAPNPRFVYTAPGTYDVSLVVGDGVRSDTRTRVGFVVAEPVTARFAQDVTTGFGPLTVQFRDASTGGPTAWSWDLDGDGAVDSNVRNPRFVYTTPGIYTVSLTASNPLSAATVVERDLIVVLAPTNNGAGPEILQYQFNEPRGAFVHNSAASTAAPATGLVRNGDGWQGDPGRARFGANEPGFGMFAQRADDSIDTGWPLVLTDGYTIMWWQRLRPGATAGNPYAFGSSGLSGFRCWSTNRRWSFRGSGVGTFDTVSRVNDPAHAGVWRHCALAVDPAAGVATWYVDGAVDATRAFAGPVRESEPGFVVGALQAGSPSSFFDVADMDDFRFYARALGPAGIAAALRGEVATTSTFGQGCSTMAAPLRVGATGGAPVLGNQGFAVTFGGVVPGSVLVANFGVVARELDFVSRRPLPIVIDRFLPGGATGCRLESGVQVSVPLTVGPGGGAALPLAVPNIPVLAGSHVYVQGIATSPVQAQVSASLDVNLQD